MAKLIALAGYGRAGKDVLGAAFIQAGWTRHCPGDSIKAIFDAVIREHLGFSAFTEDPTQKEQIRPLLVHGGQSLYEPIFRRYFSEVDALLDEGKRVINTRLFRVEEAQRWKERGGEIWEVIRLDNLPKEPEEARSMAELGTAGFIDRTLFNGGTLAQWERLCAGIVGELQ